MAAITTGQVWKEIESNLFAVLGMVTAKGEPRTVGIVYVARGQKLYIGSKADAWKVKHLSKNPHVSLTVAIPKSVPLMPWIKVPAATITFAGVARVIPAAETDPEIKRLLYQDAATDAARMADTCTIEVDPVGEFVTYGIGVPLMQMRDTVKARGRVAVK
jgi:hypothetical protein